MLIEDDETSDLRECRQEGSATRLSPGPFDVAYEAGHENDVRRSSTTNLEREVDALAVGVGNGSGPSVDVPRRRVHQRRERSTRPSRRSTLSPIESSKGPNLSFL